MLSIVQIFSPKECIPEMYGQKIMCDKIKEWEKAWCVVGIQDDLLNKWINFKWMNIQMNKWMPGFMCFQAFCYVLHGSKEVACEVLGLTEHVQLKIT